MGTESVDELRAQMEHASDLRREAEEAAAPASVLLAIDAWGDGLERKIASEKRRAPPIAKGCAVETVGASRGWGGTRYLVSAGPKWIVLAGSPTPNSHTKRYHRDGGLENYSQESIHPDDLARINRDFPARAK